MVERRQVPREDGEENALLGCVRRWGRIYAIATNSNFTTYGESYRLRQISGPVVLYDSNVGGSGGGVERTYVFDLRSGERYTVAVGDCTKNVSDCPAYPGGDRAASAIVNSRGQAVAAVVSESLGTTAIYRFTYRGRPTKLDEGASSDLPPESLRLDGDIVGWTHRGALRQATL